VTEIKDDPSDQQPSRGRDEQAADTRQGKNAKSDKQTGRIECLQCQYPGDDREKGFEIGKSAREIADGRARQRMLSLLKQSR
jgi:hypothetical protein